MADNPDNTILVTRPEDQGRAYAVELQKTFEGRAKVLCSPLLKIRPVAVEVDLEHVNALIFTSANAVRTFARLSDRRDIPCFSVGDKTAKVARNANFSTMSAAGSVRELTSLITSNLGRNTGVCLHVRGRHASGNISADLARKGYETREVVIYDQLENALNEEARRILQGTSHVIVPLFSPRTADVFSVECKGLMLGHVTIVCISTKVAARVAKSLHRDIKIAKTPTATSVTREIDAIV